MRPDGRPLHAWMIAWCQLVSDAYVCPVEGRAYLPESCKVTSAEAYESSTSINV
jgi:hypothetical protein